LREIEMIRDLGEEIRSGVEVGRDITLAQLEKDYDAIFIRAGLGATEALGIPGEEMEGVYEALAFIEQTKVVPFERVQVGRRVAVIGAGNTAIDAVTAARRLGAEEVYMVYRRSQREMPAFDYEYELAKKDAITFLWQTQPVRVLGNGRVEALECIQTRLGEPDVSGRRRPESIVGSEFRLAVEMVVKALGQKRKVEFLQKIPGIQLKAGCVAVNPETMQSGHPRYFAGGDCVNGGQEVVDAVADGKKAAAGIHQALEKTGLQRSTNA